MRKDFLREKSLNILQDTTIGVDFVEDLRHILEILEFVEFAWEDMQEKVWLWDLRKLVGNQTYWFLFISWTLCDNELCKCTYPWSID